MTHPHLLTAKRGGGCLFRPQEILQSQHTLMLSQVYIRVYSDATILCSVLANFQTVPALQYSSNFC